jgi:anti-anti-sigma factor
VPPTSVPDLDKSVARFVAHSDRRWQVEETRQATIVRLFGELDVSSSPDIRSAVTHALEHDVAIIINLSAVEFLDSSGVQSVIRPGAASRHPYVLVIPPTNAVVTRVFDLLPFPPPFRRAGSIHEALVAI